MGIRSPIIPSSAHVVVLAWLKACAAIAVVSFGVVPAAAEGAEDRHDCKWLSSPPLNADKEDVTSCENALPARHVVCAALNLLRDDLGSVGVMESQAICKHARQWQCTALGDPSLRASCTKLVQGNRMQESQQTAGDLLPVMAWKGGWQAALFADALGEYVVAQIPATAHGGQEIVSHLTPLLTLKECAALMDSLRLFAAANRSDGRDPVAPSLAQALLAPANATCLSKLAKGMSRPLEEVSAAISDLAFLTIAAAPSDRITIYAATSPPSIRELGPKESIRVSSVQMSLVAIPKRVPVTVRLAPSSPLNAPRYSKRVLMTDEGYWGLSAPTCVEVIVAAPEKEADPEIWFDGYKFPATVSGEPTSLVKRSRGQMLVDVAQHEITIRRGNRVFTRRVFGNELPLGGGCNRFNFDVTERKVVALLPVTIGPACAAAGLDDDTVDQTIRQALAASLPAGHELPNEDSWKSAIQWFQARETKPRQPQVERDFRLSDRFLKKAQELLNRDVQLAVISRVSCRRDGLRNWLYSFTASKVDVSELAYVSLDPDAVGTPIANAHPPEMDQFETPDQLSATAAAALHRVFGKAYVSVEEAQSGGANTKHNLVAKTYLPGRTLTTKELPVQVIVAESRFSRTTSCSSLETTLASSWKFSGESGKWARIDLDVARGPEQEALRSKFVFEFLPSDPGVYEIRVRVYDVPSAQVLRTAPLVGMVVTEVSEAALAAASVAAESKACLLVPPRSSSAWFQLRVSPVTLHRSSAVDSTTLQLGGGVTYGLWNSTELGFGAAYRLTWFNTNATVSWDPLVGVNPTTPLYDSESNIPHQWKRHAIVIPGYWDVARGANLIAGRLTFAADVGFLDTAGVPSALRHFLGDADPHRLLLTGSAHVGAEAFFIYPFGIRFGFGLEVTPTVLLYNASTIRGQESYIELYSVLEVAQ